MQNEANVKEIEKLVEQYFSIEETILARMKFLHEYGGICNCEEPDKFCNVDDDRVSCRCIKCGGDLNW